MKTVNTKINRRSFLKVSTTYFVDNQIDPGALGEPAYPPIFAASANALYPAESNRKAS